MGPSERAPVTAPAARYGRYIALLALVALVLITINTIVTSPNGASGIAPGHAVAPFAVPFALATLEGDADIATRADEGAAGKHPACALRGPEILNICERYERGPVVLALFVNAGSCPGVLGEMQALAPAFPGVSFIGVQMKGDRSGLRRLVRKRALSIPVGFDRDGSLAQLYKVSSCPQLSFIYPGGVMQSKALLVEPSRATLRARTQELVQATRERQRRQS